MGVVTLLKGSSSSKLAGELQGIVKSEPVEVTAKAESFGRALDSARRIVEDSQTSKSPKSNDKKKLSTKAEDAAAQGKKPGAKTTKATKEAIAEAQLAGEKESGKAGLSKADSASFESKSVAPEPTRAHKVAESVKGTLERLAAQSKSKKGSEETAGSGKSQKSTKSSKPSKLAIVVDGPELSATAQKGGEAVDESQAAKVAKLAVPASKDSAKVEPAGVASRQAVDGDVKKPSQAEPVASVPKSAQAVASKDTGALLEAKREKPVRTKDAVHAQVVKASASAPEAIVKASSQAGAVQETVKKDARGSITESKKLKRTVVEGVSVAVKDSTKEEEASETKVTPVMAESLSLAVESKESKEADVSDAISAAPVEATEHLNEETAADVEAAVLAVDLGQATKSSAQKTTGQTVAPAKSTKNPTTVPMTNQAGAETQQPAQPVEGEAVKAAAQGNKPIAASDIAAVKVPDGKMEAKASEHLYRAVNKLANGAGSGVIAKAASQSAGKTKIESKKQAKSAEENPQVRDAVKGSEAPQKSETASVKLPLAEMKAGFEQSQKQQSNKPVTVQAEPKMAKASVKVSTQSRAEAPAKKVAETVTRDDKASNPSKVDTRAAAKAGARTQPGANSAIGQVGLGSRDSMTVEKSLIGNRLFGKRVAEKEPATYRNAKGAPAKSVAPQEATTGQRVRAAKQANAARPLAQQPQQTVAADTAAMAATSARAETVSPEMSTMKKASAAATTPAGESGQKSEHTDAETTKNENARQDRGHEQGNKQSKQRVQDNRHFESKKQVETEARMKEEALDELQEASDVEVADEVAHVKQSVAANKVAVKTGVRASINPLRDVGDTPSNAAAISERREVHEQILAKNLGRNLGRIASMGTTRAKLRLHPQEFGRVDVEIRTKDGEVTLLVRTETVNAAAELNSQMNDLRASMKEHGLHLAECDVDSRGFGAEDREADGSQEGKDGDGRGRGDQDNREGRGSRRRRGRGQRIKRSAIDVVV